MSKQHGSTIERTWWIVDDDGNLTDQDGAEPRVGWWIQRSAGVAVYCHGIDGPGAGDGRVDSDDVPAAVREALERFPISGER